MTLNTQLTKTVKTFATELAALLTADLETKVLKASKNFSKGQVGHGAAKRGPGRPRKTDAEKASNGAANGHAKNGTKRDPAALQELQNKFIEYITREPNQRAEQISKALGVSSKDLMLPVRKLVASGAVKTRGNKRATTYSVA
jgi:hypothetical protein